MSTSTKRSPSPDSGSGAATRRKDIERASIAGIIGNSLLATLQIVVGIVAGSVAVIGAGIDTATDIVTSIITLLTARVVAKPPDYEHPYGHGRAETLATKTLSFIILFAGFDLGYTTLLSLIRGKADHIPSVYALAMVGATLVGKIFLAYYKNKVGKRTSSSMLIADAKNMLNDVIVQVAILIGLLFTFVFHLQFMDSVLALGVSAWILKVGFSIFWQSNTELMEGVDDPALYRTIFAAVSGVEGAYHPHRTRIRKLNNLLVVDLDIEVNGKLTVERGHEIGKSVEHAIKRDVPSVYDVIVHIEPLGNVEREERFGLSRRKLLDQERDETPQTAEKPPTRHEASRRNSTRARR